MASPFPGMDPYLEDPAFWRDFHATFIQCWRETLADQLPDAYDALVDESVNLIKMSPEIIQLIYPDIAVTRQPRAVRGKRKNGGTLLLEPVKIPHQFLEEVRQTRIEVLHRPDRKLVAVLELLSPVNKTGAGASEYSTKRNAILAQKVHLLELDLLLAGTRPALKRALPKGDYYAYLSRADDRPQCEVFAWQMREALPTIPVPLRAPDPDILIDLGVAFRLAYERGRYHRMLSYGQAPKAPLKRADAQWALTLSSRKKPRRPA